MGILSKKKTGFFSPIFLACIVLSILMFGIIPVTAETSTSLTNDTAVLPGNPLYGLKITFEKMDESFTFNTTDRLTKQLKHADTRLSEANSALIQNDTLGAERAISGYFDTANDTIRTIRELSPGSGPVGNAQSTLINQQQELEQLMNTYPGAPGLSVAFQNNARIQEHIQIPSSLGNRTWNQSSIPGEPERNTTGLNGMPEEPNGIHNSTRNLPENKTNTQAPPIQKNSTATGNEITGGKTGSSTVPQETGQNPVPTQVPGSTDKSGNDNSHPGQQQSGSDIGSPAKGTGQNLNTEQKPGNGR